MECNPVHSIKAADPWCDNHRRSVIICIREINLQVSELQNACKTLDKKRSDLEVEKANLQGRYDKYAQHERDCAVIDDPEYNRCSCGFIETVMLMTDKRNDKACVCAAKADPRDLVVCPIHG